MSAPSESHPAAFAWMAASAVLFGLMNFFARISSEHAHWAVVAATRALVGAVVAYSYGRARGVRVIAVHAPALWLRAIFGTMAMGCTFFAVASTAAPLADVVTLSNTTPVFLGLLGPIVLRERAGRRVAFAIPLSLLGVVLIIQPAAIFAGGGAVSRTPAATAAYAIALSGAVFAAFAMMSLRRAAKGETSEAIVVHFSIVAFAAFASIALLAHATVPREAIGPLVATGLCGGFAQIFMTQSYRLERAARVGPLGYLAVVVTALLGAYVLHEPLGLEAVLGMALVISSGIVVTVLGVRDARGGATRERAPL